MEFDDLSNRVMGWAIEVHRELGPGLLESTYEQCLAHELSVADRRRGQDCLRYGWRAYRAQSCARSVRRRGALGPASPEGSTAQNRA